MVIVFVQLAPWDNLCTLVQVRGGELIKKNEFNVNDQVIIKTDLGSDLGKIIKIEEKSEIKDEQQQNNFILRKANTHDIEKLEEKSRNKKEFLKKCEQLVKKRKLSMKIIDAHFSFDGSKIIFAFTSPNRIDFRLLVKDLAQEFHKSIRMHQVGARQETGLAGDVGPCGRSLCCLSFLKKLGNITVEMMFAQQLSQRGAERLSGICGRLRCCLAFENEMYKELKEKLPALGTQVKTKKSKGKVIGWHILKQTVIVEIKDEKERQKRIIEIPIDEIKKIEN